MAKKLSAWKTKGMNQDLSVSAFNPEFAYENMNLRLSTNEGNTLMSWVNEKGTKLITLKIDTAPWEESDSKEYAATLTGIPVGTAILNHQLVVFTHYSDTNKDYIYKFTAPDNEGVMNGMLLYSGNLGFDTAFPLETLESYEAEDIQKVYFTDGKNQPRVINIAASTDIIQKWNEEINENGKIFFNFVPEVNLESGNSTISVTKNPTAGGLFAPGVIQYCFTYAHKHGQQTNIIDVSPIEYLTHVERGASPEEKVGCSFNISIKGIDTNYDYIRLYSIQRTSINATPICKLLDAIPVYKGVSSTAVDFVTLSSATTAPTISIDGGSTFLSIGEVQTQTGKTIRYSGDPTLHTYDYDFLDSSSGLILNYSDFNNLVIKYVNPSTGMIQKYTWGKDVNSTSRIYWGLNTGFALVEQQNSGAWERGYFKLASSSDSALYVDNGTTGSTIDPTELLYIGGKEITALTMVDKDQTLFIGNITQKNSSVEDIQAAVDSLSNSDKEITFTQDSTKTVAIGAAEGVYPYINSLKASQSKITTFKGGETYRFGMQFQKTTGEWSEPVFIGDYTNDLYPTLDGTVAKLTYATKSFTTSSLAVDTDTYKRVRPVIVFPNVSERNILCQGVINPTVFNVEDRLNSTPFSQASWCFRPHTVDNSDNWTGVESMSNFTHYQSVFCQDANDGVGNEDCMTVTATNNSEYIRQAKKVEIQGSRKIYSTPFSTAVSNAKANSQFFVDQSIVTLNSPDIDFDTDVQTYSTDGLKLRVVGTINIAASASSHSITTSSDKMQAGFAMKFGKGVSDSNVLQYWGSEEGTQQVYGTGETNKNVFQKIEDSTSNVRARLNAGHIWNDSLIISRDVNYFYLRTKVFGFGNYTSMGRNNGDDADTSTPYAFGYPVDFFVLPWQRKGSLNNDNRKASDATSILKTKKWANLLYAYDTTYTYDLTGDTTNNNIYYNNINTRIHLTENSFIKNIRLTKQSDSSSVINYYPNCDKVLTNTEGYYSLVDTRDNDNYTDLDAHAALWDGILSPKTTELMQKLYDPVEMKYKSTSHAVISLNAADGNTAIPIMPYIHTNDSQDLGKWTVRNGSTFWGDTISFETQKYVTTDKNSTPYNFLLLGELYKDVDDSSRFGGTSKNAIKNNNWTIAGDTVNMGDSFTLNWTVGDTYYQRYDCLKTYPFTNEDTNQLIEILSFMCETHVNIDGRYDANRGQINNVNMSPENFGLINDVYSQVNNFFVNKKVNDDESADTTYPNWITYSKTKESGADVDLWTNVTLGSTLELDGDKGKISSLQRFNDNIIAFQDSAISQVLYNENVQISSTAGVPIEIANSGKVQGKRYLSDTIGCANKWSIASSPAGIYFVDSNNKGIYLFNGQPNDLTTKLGFNTWAKNNINTNDIWSPEGFDGIVSYYDRLNQEVLFVNRDKALAYSEKIGTFTSFYNYGAASYFCNFDDMGIWIKAATVSETNLWQHQGGDYCSFFGVDNYPYWMTLIGNPEPQTDKTFTNLEFRANIDDEGNYNEDGVYVPYIPFDLLESWDEYQHGIAKLSIKNGHNAMVHHSFNGTASLKRKYRMWRCDIPRDNFGNSSLSTFDFTFDSTFKDNSGREAHPLDRMRNPWLYLKLYKGSDTSQRAEIHDLLMTYFV